ncbi:MAG: hypothetical protein U1A78_25375 [Polyangia bacterium]
MKLLFSLGPWVLSALAIGGFALQERRVTQLERRVYALRESPAEAPPHGDLTALAARVDRLEKTESWRAATPPPAAGAPPSATATATAPGPGHGPGELQQLREDVDALLTGEATATEQGKARLRALIAETQQQQWSERQQSRDARILQRLGETARLTPRQHDDLAKVLDAERAQRATLMASARGGQRSMDELRPALQALRADTEQKAKAILDPEQLAQFTAARAPGRGPRGGANPANPAP